MKKLLILLLALTMVASLAACGGDTPDDTKGTEPNSAAPAEGFMFNYKGTKITIHAEAAPILAALGEAKSYTEQASCAFEGLDKTYYYGSFYLDTYPKGDKDYVYGFWFADDSVSTEEGIYIGATKAQVEKAYGAEAFNGSNAYNITKGDNILTIILENDVVTSIQYSLVLN